MNKEKFYPSVLQRIVSRILIVSVLDFYLKETFSKNVFGKLYFTDYSKTIFDSRADWL